MCCRHMSKRLYDAVGGRRVWIVDIVLREGAWCDGHVMQVGISGIRHVDGNRCIPLAMGKWVMGYMDRNRSNEDGNDET